MHEQGIGEVVDAAESCQAPVALLIEILTPIWETVLGRAPIGSRDGFFELGGEMVLAVRLFGEIEMATGRRIPPATIRLAPTIAELAAVLQQGGAVRLSPVILLKSGAGAPAVFMAPGIGGNAFDLLQFGKRLRTRGPVYGVQARAPEPVAALNESVEDESVDDVAQRCVSLIRGVQPRGPYVLVGYSFGGLIMWETAHRLSECGERVGLALVDTYTHPRYWPPAQRIWLLLRRALRRAGAMTRLSPRAWIPHLVAGCSKVLDRVRFRLGGRSQQHADMGATSSPSARLPHARDSAAWARYRPRPYDGKVIYLRAETVTVFPDDPLTVWGKLASRIEIHTVPGDHVGIVNEHVESAAAQLSGCLRDMLESE